MAREWIFLECAECANRNYRTSKKAGPNIPKLERPKFCPFCRKHTSHKEKKK